MLTLVVCDCEALHASLANSESGQFLVIVARLVGPYSGLVGHDSGGVGET